MNTLTARTRAKLLGGSWLAVARLLDSSTAYKMRATLQYSLKTSRSPEKPQVFNENPLCTCRSSSRNLANLLFLKKATTSTTSHLLTGSLQGRREYDLYRNPHVVSVFPYSLQTLNPKPKTLHNISPSKCSTSWKQVASARHRENPCELHQGAGVEAPVGLSILTYGG